MAFTNEEVAIVKGMLRRGDKQSDIAAYFGVNGGRIAEINTGANGGEIQPASEDHIPPPGPYMVVPRAFKDSFESILREIHRWESLTRDE